MIAPRRAARLALVVAVAATGLGLFVPASAPASCVGPSITVQGALPTASSTRLASQGDVQTPVVRLAPGAAFTVTGEFFFTGCADTVGTQTYGPGCSRQVPQEKTLPQKDVPLVLTWNGKEYPLGTADAQGDRYTTRWEVTLPAEVTAGHGLAVLQAGTARPVAVEVTG